MVSQLDGGTEVAYSGKINLKLQLNLLEEDQILSVKVKRKFPTTLEISIQEQRNLY